jgi:alpha-amylase/alpha-mannosidase (GH57 family)
MNKIYFSLAIHNHQPVGNFDFVFEEAYNKAYEPMLAALEQHPGVRLALHYSSCAAFARWSGANRSRS